MSNCIYIHDPEVEFPADILDFDRLMVALEKHQSHGHRSCNQPRDDKDLDPLICQAAKWFLVPDRNFKVDQKRRVAWVSFGTGNSSHTNRDFKQTLAVICAYLHKPVQLEIQFSDEFDGFKHKFTTKVDLIPHEWPEWRGL